MSRSSARASTVARRRRSSRAAATRCCSSTRRDFGTGSSSRSTRLLHCGLRYLAPGRFPYQWIARPGKLLAALSMARASMRAREEFVLDAPERVRNMTSGFPVWQGMQYRPWHVDLGLRVVAAFGSAIVFPNSASTRPGANRRIRRASKRHTSSHIGSAGNHLTTMLASTVTLTDPDTPAADRRYRSGSSRPSGRGLDGFARGSPRCGSRPRAWRCQCCCRRLRPPGSIAPMTTIVR